MIASFVAGMLKRTHELIVVTVIVTSGESSQIRWCAFLSKLQKARIVFTRTSCSLHIFCVRLCVTVPLRKPPKLLHWDSSKVVFMKGRFTKYYASLEISLITFYFTWCCLQTPIFGFLLRVLGSKVLSSKAKFSSCFLLFEKWHPANDEVFFNSRFSYKHRCVPEKVVGFNRKRVISFEKRDSLWSRKNG